MILIMDLVLYFIITLCYPKDDAKIEKLNNIQGSFLQQMLKDLPLGTKALDVQNIILISF